jgi:hypothetical protein
VRTLGIVALEGTREVTVRGCTIRMGFPPWTYWSDVKGKSPDTGKSPGAGFDPAEDVWNSFGIVGVFRCSAIEGNVLIDCFDGVNVRAKSESVRVAGNAIVRSRDDAIDLSPWVENVEIAHNLIWRCFEGISLIGTTDPKRRKDREPKGGRLGEEVRSDGEMALGAEVAKEAQASEEQTFTAGEVFIHHNLIDVSALHLAERAGDFAYFHNEMSAGIPFGRHDCDVECTRARWLLYNNTIVTGPRPKLLPLAMPRAIFTHNLVVDEETAAQILDWKTIESGEFSSIEEVRLRYRPLVAPTPAATPPDASDWPQFDAKSVGALPN